MGGLRLPHLRKDHAFHNKQAGAKALCHYRDYREYIEIMESKMESTIVYIMLFR